MAPFGLDWMDPTQTKKGGPMNVKVPKIQDLLERDPYLKPHEREIRRRYGNFEDILQRLEKVEGGIEKMAKGKFINHMDINSRDVIQFFNHF